MKIKTQFFLLIFGMVVIPIVAFNLDNMRIEYTRTRYAEQFSEYRRLIRLAGLSPPPRSTRSMMFFIIKAVVLFSAIMSLLIVRSITRSVAILEDNSRRIANGELNLTVDVKGSNEITSLSGSLNKMRSALKEEEKRRYFFVMGITHDLKTPLALIKANVEAIEDGIMANPHDKKHSLHIMSKKVEELEGMINNLLDFARIDSGEIARNVSMTNLPSFLFSYIERVVIDAELLDHKVESTVNLPASLAVTMDSFLVQRALDNIVYNSFRYTPKGSCLFIAAELVTLVNNQTVTLTISDNGGGIDQKDLPYIFDHFYRGSASREDQGMGMGLTVTKSIIDSHGWSVSASSAVGKGAGFTVSIPLACIK